MTAMPASLEHIVGETVRKLMAPHLPSPCDSSVTQIPLRLQTQEDVAQLLSWFARLCADGDWRQRFLSGQLQLSIAIGPIPDVRATSAGSAPVADEQAPQGRSVTLNEAVVTEAFLRQRARRYDVITLPMRAVITPSAKDYARSAGIQLERRA